MRNLENGACFSKIAFSRWKTGTEEIIVSIEVLLMYDLSSVELPPAAGRYIL